MRVKLKKPDPATLAKILGMIGIFVVLVFLIILIFLNQLKSEIFAIVVSYGYIAIFLITFLVDTLAQPLGPEIPIIAGEIAGLNIWIVGIITLIGSFLASIFNYWIGKFFYPRLCEHGQCNRYINAYHKYGIFALLVAAIGPVPYVPFCWLSGAFALKKRRFFFFGILPRMIRVIVVTGIIYLIL